MQGYGAFVINHGDERDSDVFLFMRKERIVEIRESFLVSFDDTEFLLPPALASQFISYIMVYIHKPVIILHDSEKRVHSLLLGGCNFMIFTAAWKRPDLVGPEVKNFRSVYDSKAAPKISCSVITLLDVDDDNDTLLVSEPHQLEGFENKVDRLLLPHNIRADYRRDLKKYLNTEVPVIYDQYGRIFALTLGVGTHMLLMGLWKVMSLKKIKVNISGIDEQDDSLSTFYHMGLKLFLPKGLPMEFRDWQPHGDYDVEHDDDNRVHSITREEDTKIYLSKFWDIRYDLPLLIGEEAGEKEVF